MDKRVMSENHLMVVRDQADKIRQKLKDGYLYGVPIDINDPDQVLVAAVCLTQMEETQRAEKDRKFLWQMINPKTNSHWADVAANTPGADPLTGFQVEEGEINLTNKSDGLK